MHMESADAATQLPRTFLALALALGGDILEHWEVGEVDRDHVGEIRLELIDASNKGECQGAKGDGSSDDAPNHAPETPRHATGTHNLSTGLDVDYIVGVAGNVPLGGPAVHQCPSARTRIFGFKIYRPQTLDSLGSPESESREASRNKARETGRSK